MRTVGRRLLLIVLLLALALLTYGWFLTQKVVTAEDAVSLALPNDKTDDWYAELDTRRRQAEYDGDVQAARSFELAEARRQVESTLSENGIGAVYIPSAGISQPLLAGTSHEVLLNGVGTPNADQVLGRGLFVGLAHEMPDPDQLLGHLGETDMGGDVYFTDFDRVYRYQVTHNDVVHMTQGELLEEPAPGQPARFVLYRCEGGYGTEYRQVVAGDFQESELVTEAEDAVLEGLGLTVLEEENQSEETESETEFDELDDRSFLADKALAFYGQVGSRPWLSLLVFVMALGLYVML